jgi:DNA-binding NarL/FixJ family response regulator
LIGKHAGGVFEVVNVLSDNGVNPTEKAKRFQPDVILYDTGAGNVDAAAISRLRQACPLAVIIVCALSGDPDWVGAAIKAGADSYLVRDNMRPEQVAQAVELICGAKMCLFPCSVVDFMTAHQLEEEWALLI